MPVSPGDGPAAVPGPAAGLRTRLHRRPGRQGREDHDSPCSKVFLDKDATLAEINPLAITKKGDVVVLDAKIDFDDNALFRHKDIEALRDLNEENPAEVRAGEGEPELHPARRQHRLPGQRGRAGDGDDGHHQVPRRQPGELPRRRRRRDARRRRSRRSASSCRTRR